MVFRRRKPHSWLSWTRQFFFPRKGWTRAMEYLGHRVKRLPDSPHRVAIGVACGVAVCFTPFFGLHFVLAAVCAWIVGGNILAALIGTAAGNPLTFPLIAGAAMPLGRQMLGIRARHRDVEQIEEAFNSAMWDLWQSIKAVFGLGQADLGGLSRFFHEILLPYLVGGVPMGLAAGLATYLVSRPLVATYQERRRRKFLRILRAERLDRPPMSAEKDDGTAHRD